MAKSHQKVLKFKQGWSPEVVAIGGHKKKTWLRKPAGGIWLGSKKMQVGPIHSFKEKDRATGEEKLGRESSFSPG